MKKMIKRWYEKSETLKAFMASLKSLDIDVQCEIAIDMIIQSSNLIDRDYSKIIEDVGNYNPKDFKRWYDKNPNIHLAIECLKDLEPEQRENLVKEFQEKITNLKKNPPDKIKEPS